MLRWLVVAAVAVTACGREAPISRESLARDQFIRELTRREGIPAMWHVMSRLDVVFQDGWSLPELIDPGPTVRWTDASRVTGSVPAIPVRWMGPRAHARLRFPVLDFRRDMQLRIWGQVDPLALSTRPRITATFDGLEYASVVVGEDGRFDLMTVIPGVWAHGWADVYLTVSSVGEPWREPERLRVARLEGLAWEPVE
ncbi:MAG: hypothetical protein R3B06_09105 [Kofleriaceae bacterium]